MSPHLSVHVAGLVLAELRRRIAHFARVYNATIVGGQLTQYLRLIDNPLPMRACFAGDSSGV
jgi:hypothetical protein